MKVYTIAALLILCTVALEGCAPLPSEKEAKDAIIKHFEGRGYRVIALETGGIKEIELAKKGYMGTPGFVIEIRSIVLEGKAETGQLSFRNGVIQVREQPGQKGRWLVSNISGIPVL
jgi:hypothetical protein